MTCHTWKTKSTPKDCSCAYPCIIKAAPEQTPVEGPVGTQAEAPVKAQSVPVQYPFVCDKCGNGFTHKDILIEHKNLHQEDEYAHYCGLCGKGFTHKGNLFYHKKEHLTLKSTKDYNVSEESQDKAKGLKNKHQKFHFSGVHTCEICSAVFLSLPLLTEHMSKNHAENNEIVIEETDLNYQTPVMKQIHCALNEEPGCTFQCETEEQLKRHIEIKHRSKTHLPCTVCNLNFRDLDDLSRHMNMAHKSLDSTFKCNQCEKPLKDKQDLKQHITTVHWSYKPCKNHKTDNCSASPCRFNHIKLQSNQEICYKCGKFFSSKAEIISHIKTTHGHTVCHKFMQNKCDRSSEECLYNHTSSNQTQQQDFQTHHTPPLHSPVPGMHNMSEHLQQQWQIKSPQAKEALQINVIQMLPQIVAQIVAELTKQINK